ncbi:MAG: hypothetical protein LBP59_10825 [Planctomycetaceae bacterium]|jgi:hypothetical protein|nr:hypothetical protein [Planctomycetaceae bacterium]
MLQVELTIVRSENFGRNGSVTLAPNETVEIENSDNDLNEFTLFYSTDGCAYNDAADDGYETADES